jgi:hypothetical protein
MSSSTLIRSGDPKPACLANGSRALTRTSVRSFACRAYQSTVSPSEYEISPFISSLIVCKMEPVVLQSIDQMSPKFTCNICCKRFDNSMPSRTASNPLCSANGKHTEKSQIRHSSYCRKKARNPPRPRKRSCLICTKAKTHCDAEFPACSRCLKKDVTCLYQFPPQPTIRSEQPQSEFIIPPSEMLQSLESFSDSSLVQYYGGSISYDPEAFNAADNSIFQNADTFGSLPLVPVTTQSVLGREHTSFDLVHHLSEDFLLADHRHSSNFSSLEVLNPLGSEPALRAPRAFWPKTVRYRKLSLNIKYVICTLSAYPHMMLPDKGMPPFIHPKCLARDFDQVERVTRTSLPGPLATCAGIIALWSAKNENNSFFIWRAIRAEQERISEEVGLILNTELYDRMR